jgi:hypothetical protein
MNKSQTSEELYFIRTRLNEASEYLENSKKNISNANYTDLIKTYGKTYRLKNDLIVKIHYTASWGDQYGSLYETVMSIQKSQIDFAKKLKAISTNIVISDIICGPVKAELISPRINENNWYYILKRALILAIRANQHSINAYERKKNTVEEAIKQKSINKEKKEKKEKMEELNAQIEKDALENEKLFDFLKDNNFKDNWDDSDSDNDSTTKTIKKN